MTLFDKSEVPSSVTYVSGRSLVPSTSSNYAAFARADSGRHYGEGLSFGGGMLANF